MGRHSSPEQSSFFRSLAGWVLPWVLVAAVAVVAVTVGVSALGQQPLDAEPPAASNGDASDAPTPTPTSTPSPRPTPEDDGKGDKAEPDEAPPERPRKLITEGITVQVLNASDSPGTDDAIRARLARHGFEIVSVLPAASTYRRTTVFWSSEESRPAAERLAARYGWRSDLKPANLSPSVSIHVVVGLDEA